MCDRRQQRQQAAGEEHNNPRPDEELTQYGGKPDVPDGRGGRTAQRLRRRSPFTHLPFPPGDHEDDADKRRSINKEGGTNPGNRNHDTSQSRTNRAREIEFDPVQRRRGSQIFLRDQFGQDGPPRWTLKGVSRGESERE